MFSRYDGRSILVNNASIYKDLFRQRGVKFIKQYSTPTLTYPSPEQIAEFNVIGHTWGVGSALWKIASKHYGDSELWWVIAFYNGVMSEVEFVAGQTVYIPLPLERVLKAYNL